MIGQEECIRQYIPSHEVLFQVLDGVNVLVNPPALKSSLLSIFEKVDLLFQSRITEQELQIGLFRVPIPNYEKDAFKEGFVNALIHRDYYRMGAVQIQLQNNCMTITSPGGFLEGVTPENILTVAPTPRNVRLVEAVKRIGLAERTGRGIPKIYAAMLRNGHEMPDYNDSSNTSVVLRLNGSVLDKSFIEMIVNEESRLNKTMPVDALIVLSVLRTERRASIALLADKIQKKEADAKTTTEWLIELGMVEGIGNGLSRHYMLSSKVYSLSNNAVGYTRQRGWNTMQEKELILTHLASFNRITRQDVMELCRCTAEHASWLLKTMRIEESIYLIKKGKISYYCKK